MPDADFKIYGLRLRPELYEELRKAAYDRDRPMSEIVVEAIEAWLAKKSKTPAKRKK